MGGGNGSDTEEEGRGRRHTFGSPSSSSADLKIAKIKSSQNVTYMSAPPVKTFAQPWSKKVKPLVPSDETCSEAVGPSVVLVVFSFDQGAKHHFPPPPILLFISLRPSSHLLVGHHAVGLQGGGMPAEQSRPRPIVLAEDSPIDVVEAVARDQAVPAGRTGKTLEERNII